MSKKVFDPNKPHHHFCPECRKEVFCAGQDCELPQEAECYECQNGYSISTLDNYCMYERVRPPRYEGDNDVLYRG